MISKLDKKYIEEFLEKKIIIFNKNLREYTSFKIGGPADILISPKNLEEVIEILDIVLERQYPFSVLGGCSNVLIKDTGLRGIVMLMCDWDMGFVTSKVIGNKVILEVDAGVNLKTVCSYSIKNNLIGLNFALGIPGTIGGAIFCNSSTNYGCIFDILESVTLLNNKGNIIKVDKCNKKFDYYKSLLKETKVILKCELGLIRKSTNFIKKKVKQIIKNRIKTQPIFLYSAGCFFKNPIVGPSAGSLIDMIGLKGEKIGGAMVSEKHANYIINIGNATAYDVLKLSDFIRESVYKCFKIELMSEVDIF